MIPIPTRTELGSGLATPIAKTMGHLYVLWSAFQREWPLTIEEFHAELTEASTHVVDVDFLETFGISAAFNEQFATWNQRLHQAVGHLRTAADEKPDDPAQSLADATIGNEFKELIRTGWQVLSSLDYEMLGFAPTETDPGERP